jgi:hypothetical protein
MLVFSLSSSLGLPHHVTAQANHLTILNDSTTCNTTAIGKRTNETLLGDTKIAAASPKRSIRQRMRIYPSRLGYAGTSRVYKFCICLVDFLLLFAKSSLPLVLPQWHRRYRWSRPQSNVPLTAAANRRRLGV